MHPLSLELLKLIEQARYKGLGNETIRVKIKEVLQDYLLHAIYTSNNFNRLIFIGGTALRKLYGLQRMSEDIDLQSSSEIDLNSLGECILKYFRQIRYENVDFSVQKSAHIHRLTIKFAILFDLKFTRNKSEKLFIKIELEKEKNPGRPEITLYSKNSLDIPIKHFSLETMMAGKIKACLNRVWEKGKTGIKVKGRDYFDLIWYMEKNIRPDMKDLSAVFAQLDQKIEKIKPADLLIDLRPYVEDLNYLTSWCKNFHQLYQKYRVNYGGN